MARKRVGANKRQKIAEKRKKVPEKNRGGAGKLLFTCLKIVFLLSGLAAAGFWGVKKAVPYIGKIDFLKIENIMVNGNKHINTAEILSLASIEKGVFMLDLKIADISRKLHNIPWVEKVSIRRKIPNTVLITVYERKPIAFVNLGPVYLTDRSGFLWPLKPNTYWNLPVVSGLKDTVAEGTTRRLTTEGLLRMNSFFEEVHKVDNSIPPGIAQVDFSKKDIVRIRLESIPTQVALNSAALGESLNNLCEILKTVEGTDEKAPGHINLCYSNIAFVR